MQSITYLLEDLLMMPTSIIGSGTYFGELALYKHMALRAATITCLENCTFATLTKDVFQEILTSIEERTKLKHLKFL